MTLESAAEGGVPLDFELFRRRAYLLTGLDLTSYKAPQMHRRLSALLGRLGLSNYGEYARLLAADAVRRQEFRDYVTINVSEFFRDVHRFGELEARVLPDLLRRRASLRVWSAGCSNGSEAYSLSILLQELSPNGGHAILATDVDQTILDRARAATDYLASDVRNVVIYFTEAAKERIFDGFVARLGPGGVLFLGGTEAIMRPQVLGLSVIGPGFYRKAVDAC